MAKEPNQQLANELHKPIIRKFKERKLYSFFRGNIWGADLADMQSLSKYNNGNNLKRKKTKQWVDQGSQFYNNSFKDFFKINNIEMYSSYNEGKSVVAERFIEH